MKTQRIPNLKRGFTLMELMVAMAITTIIVTVLVSITSIALETWNRSRSELRAARQAKAMVDTMARDFEALVVRRGNESEWLSAVSSQPGTSTSASELVFFTAATDRYEGNIGGADDKGGDVSCVGYVLNYKDPIGGGTSDNQTFVLNRYLVNPDEAFKNLLGQKDLAGKFMSNYGTLLSEEKYFVCENVFQFTIAFYVEVDAASASSGTSQVENRIVTINPAGTTKKFSIKGTEIETTATDPALSAGKITAVEISLTVLSDAGVDLIRRTPSVAKKADFMAKNSYQYSKLVQLPGM